MESDRVATSPGNSHDEPLRGMQISRTAYAVMLIGVVLIGALRASIVDRAMHEGRSIAHVSANLSVLMGIAQIVSLAASAAIIYGLSGISKAPAAARTAQVTQWAQAMLGASIITHFIWPVATQILTKLVSLVQLGLVFAALGSIESLIDLAGYLFFAEAILRLHRHAARGNTQAELSRQGDEGIMYGGLVAAVMLRTLASYAGPILAALGFSLGGGEQWTGYLLRLPCSIAIYGLLIWQLLATEKLLRDHPAALAKADA